MTNKLIKHWNDAPILDIILSGKYPLAQATGCPDAFTGTEPNWDMLRTHYGDSGYIWQGTDLEWKEVVLAFDMNELERRIKAGEQLEGHKLDSFTLQAQAKGVITDRSVSRTGLYCFTQSKDKEHLIMGIRAPGSNYVGRIIASPVGHATYKEEAEHGDIITDAVILEGSEEIGVRPEDMQGLHPIGFFQENGNSPGNVFFYIMQLNTSAEEIIKRHTGAMNLYSGWKRDTKGSKVEKEIRARRKMEESARRNPMFPKDAWENDTLFALPNDPGVMRDRIQEILQIDSMPGALALYFLHEFGIAEYERLIDVPEMRGKVVEAF